MSPFKIVIFPGAFVALCNAAGHLIQTGWFWSALGVFLFLLIATVFVYGSAGDES